MSETPTPGIGEASIELKTELRDLIISSIPEGYAGALCTHPDGRTFGLWLPTEDSLPQPIGLGAVEPELESYYASAAKDVESDLGPITELTEYFLHKDTYHLTKRITADMPRSAKLSPDDGKPGIEIFFTDEQKKAIGKYVMDTEAIGKMLDKFVEAVREDAAARQEEAEMGTDAVDGLELGDLIRDIKVAGAASGFTPLN